MLSHQETDSSPPFLALSNNLTQVFQFTCQQLKLISDSILSSIDAQNPSIHPDTPKAVIPSSDRSCPSIPPIVQVSPFSNNPAPAPQSQHISALVPNTLSPQKCPISCSPSVQNQCHETFSNPNQHISPTVEHASAVACPDAPLGNLNLQARISPRTPSSLSHTLDGNSDLSESEKVDQVGQNHAEGRLSITSLPVHQDGSLRARLLPNLDLKDNPPAPRLARKSLIDRIAALSPAVSTPNSSASSRSTSMDLESTSRSSGSIRPSNRRRSSPRPLSRHGGDGATSKLAHDQKHIYTRPPSPTVSHISRESHRYRQSNPLHSSRDVYDSYQPPLKPIASRFRSRSRSRSVSQRRGRVAAGRHSLAPVKDQTPRDYEEYMDETVERPSYMRLISILRSLQAPNYNSYIFHHELRREFYWFTQRADTREEQMLAFLYNNPRLMHRFLTVAMRRHIVIYRADPKSHRQPTIELDVQFRTRANSNGRR